MSGVVHLLWFAKEMPQGREDIELLIGVYSSEAEAKAAIERMKNKRGFADFQDGFQISAYPLNRDHWEEGFVIDQQLTTLLPHLVEHRRYTHRAAAGVLSEIAWLRQLRGTIAANLLAVFLFPEDLVVAQIKGIAGMTPGEIAFQLNRGGKFVVYRYCYSVVALTVMESTAVYLIRSDESRIIRGLPWTLLTLVAGWWGIPWGPIRTVQSLWINLHGGTNVTAQIAATLPVTDLKWDVVGEP